MGHNKKKMVNLDLERENFLDQVSKGAADQATRSRIAGKHYSIDQLHLADIAFELEDEDCVDDVEEVYGLTIENLASLIARLPKNKNRE